MALSNINLTGHLLIAMPNMADPFFAKTVTLICTHNEDGAMGIIINQPTNVKLDELYDNIQLPLNNDAIKTQPVLFGGPVQPERGFVLHQSGLSAENHWDSCIIVRDNIMLTTSKDILAAIGTGNGPRKFHFSLGYAGWSPGQLEAEMLKNSWLSVEASDIDVLNTLLYDTAHENMFDASIKLLGIDPSMLSDVAGHA